MLAQALALIFACAMPALAQSKAGTLANPGFEKGGRTTVRGWRAVHPHWPRAPRFAPVTKGAFEGKRCGEILATGGGYASWNQTVRIPRKARSLRLSGAIMVAERNRSGCGFLWVQFEKKNATQNPIETRRIKEIGGWQKVQTEVSIPAGVRTVHVRCMVAGVARVRFDAIELKWVQGPRRPMHRCETVVTNSYYRVLAPELAPGASTWAEVGVPQEFDGQIPLTMKVISTPAKAAYAARLIPDRENRYLRVHLKQTRAQGSPIFFRIRSQVLCTGGASQVAKGAQLAKASKIPPSLRPFLRPAPGIESDDRRIRKIAKGLHRTDLATLTRDLRDWYRGNMTGSSGPQGALQVLARGGAACTGNANLGAAILRAAGVPTRVLACLYTRGEEQQEHYFNQVWTPDLGWARLEPSSGRLFTAPWEHVVLRVIYPDSERARGFVPLHWRTPAGTRLRSWTGELESPTTFQIAQKVGGFEFSAKDLERVRSVVKPAWKALEAKSDVTAWRFAPHGKDRKMSKHGRAQLEALMKASR